MAKQNGKQLTKAAQVAKQDASTEKVVPPLKYNVWEPKPSWVVSAGEALSRFPVRHFIILCVIGALVGVVALIVRVGHELTTLGLTGAIVISLLINVFGAVAWHATKPDAEASQKDYNGPAELGDGSQHPKNP